MNLTMQSSEDHLETLALGVGNTLHKKNDDSKYSHLLHSHKVRSKPDLRKAVSVNKTTV